MVDFQALDALVEEGLLSKKQHPIYPELVLYNYTGICQIQRAWNELTLNNRGHIYNVKTGERVAVPFPKFFNFDEYVNTGGILPEETPQVFDKVDGSLGIVYFYDDKWHVSTRGSFNSDQALWAQDWLNKYVILDTLNKTFTYLFEIIYPENRIVLNYEFSGLVLLGIVTTRTGEDVTYRLPYCWLPLLAADPPGYGKSYYETVRVVQSYPFSSVEELLGEDSNNREGFVLYYPTSGFRVKLKFEEYVRLHKVMTGLSVLGIWELLAANTDLKVYLEGVPDEFYNWFNGIKDSLEEQFKAIQAQALSDFESLGDLPETIDRTLRGELARKITQFSNPGLVFNLLDKKPIDEAVWKLIRPKHVEKKDEES